MFWGVTKNNENAVAYWEHGIWRFSKKIRNKTFYFHTKNITLFFFYLVLALESISGVKSWLFGKKKSAKKTEDPFSTTLNIIFSQKLSNYHISCWRKVFFSYLIQFFSFILKLPTVARVHQKKIWTQSLIKTRN
jgi:hypothetical protein